MKPGDIRDEQIERYVHNEMDDAERSAFEVQLNNDNSLRTEVEKFIEFKNYYSKSLVDFKLQLKEVESQLEKEHFFDNETKVSSRKRKKNQLPWIAAAASLALIISISYFYFKTYDWKELALAAAKNDFSIKRSVTAEQDSLFYSGNYTAFIEWAKKTLPDNLSKEDRNFTRLQLTRAYILSGKAGECISYYNSLPESEKNCELQYCVAIAFISIGKKKEAGDFFTAVADGCFPYDEKAQQWLKKIN